jgi:hypothetical protein
VDEMIPGDDDDLSPPDDAEAIRDEATLARIGGTSPEDLSPKAQARYGLFTAVQDVSTPTPRWSPPETGAEILERIKQDRNIYGSPENAQVVLQMAILETLLSIEEKLS